MKIFSSNIILALLATSVRANEDIDVSNKGDYLNFTFIPKSDYFDGENLEDYTTIFTNAYEKSAGLDTRGNNDAANGQEMNLTRCFSDKINSLIKSSASIGKEWDYTLTYNISKYPTNLNYSIVYNEIERAFKIWEDVTPLKFILKPTGGVDINFSFKRGDHRDTDPLTSSAMAVFLPQGGGDIHFNIDMNWTVNSYNGVSLYQTAVHSLGHLLGLKHSSNELSVMWPCYTYNPNFQLDHEDIQAIQAIYGSKLSNTNNSDCYCDTSTVTYSNANGTKCSINKIDAMLDYDGDTYLFEGDKYWKFRGKQNGGMEAYSEYPNRINETWSELPGNIDAAFAHPNGRQFFFKGDQYWKYKNNKIERDRFYPQLISRGFPGVPDNLNAALALPDGTTIFFKDNRIWVSDYRNKIYNKMPLKRNWIGVPSDLDAAVLRSDGYLYFLKNGTVYKKQYSKQSPRILLTYPLPFDWWIGCRDT